MNLFSHPRLALDCDGVLADFDSLAAEIFGMAPHDFEDVYGSKIFWKTLRDYRDENGHGFFECLPLMPDAMDLFRAVKKFNPIILTGCPLGDWAQPQKLAWAKRHFPNTQMITCMARDKINHLEKPGDILIDDKTKYQHIWEEGGGVFVHHTSTADSLVKLKEMGIL
jgi:hypothetical protein